MRLQGNFAAVTLYIDNLGGIGLELSLLIKQSVPVELTALNSRDLPDAYWLGIDGQSYGYEIKQPGEVLGQVDNVEEQLSREYNQVDHLGLLICGVVVPCEGHGCKVLNFSADGRTGYLAGVRGGAPFNQDYGGYRNKLRAWESWDITVSEMPTKLALARHLVAAYNYCQKPPDEHHTFRKPLRTKQVMPQWDAYTLTMLGLHDPATGRTFCGPDRAQALMDRFGNPYSLFSAEAKEIASVAGIGPKTAQAVLRAVGRGD